MAILKQEETGIPVTDIVPQTAVRGEQVDYSSSTFTRLISLVFISRTLSTSGSFTQAPPPEVHWKVLVPTRLQTRFLPSLHASVPTGCRESGTEKNRNSQPSLKFRCLSSSLTKRFPRVAGGCLAGRRCEDTLDGVAVRFGEGALVLGADSPLQDRVRYSNLSGSSIAKSLAAPVANIAQSLALTSMAARRRKADRPICLTFMGIITRYHRLFLM